MIDPTPRPPAQQDPRTKSAASRQPRHTREAEAYVMWGVGFELDDVAHAGFELGVDVAGLDLDRDVVVATSEGARS